jgi:hypothetical protein
MLFYNYNMHIITCIYDGYATLQINLSAESFISTLCHGLFESRIFSLNHANKGGPISFDVGKDGIAIVILLCLSLRFRFIEDSLNIDEEVFDVDIGNLTHTIGQVLNYNNNSNHWLLWSGRFRIYN